MELPRPVRVGQGENEHTSGQIPKRVSGIPFPFLLPQGNNRHFLGVPGEVWLIVFTTVGSFSFPFFPVSQSSCWLFGGLKTQWVSGIPCGGCCPSLGSRWHCHGVQWIRQYFLKNRREVGRPSDHDSGLLLCGWGHASQRGKSACVLHIVLWGPPFLGPGPLPLPGGSGLGHVLPACPSCLAAVCLSQRVLACQRLWVNR